MDQFKSFVTVARNYLGGRIYVETPADLARVEKMLGERFEIIDRDSTLERPRRLSGYRAVHLQVKLPDGMTAEIQLHPGTYRSFAEESRAAYVKSRRIKTNRFTPTMRREAERADRAIAKKYTEAYQEWLARTKSR